MRKFVILLGDLEDDVFETKTAQSPEEAVKEYLGADYDRFKNLYQAIELQ
jgi:hypothetical protein